MGKQQRVTATSSRLEDAVEQAIAFEWANGELTDAATKRICDKLGVSSTFVEQVRGYLDAVSGGASADDLDKLRRAMRRGR